MDLLRIKISSRHRICIKKAFIKSYTLNRKKHNIKQAKTLKMIKTEKKLKNCYEIITAPASQNIFCFTGSAKLIYILKIIINIKTSVFTGIN